MSGLRSETSTDRREDTSSGAGFEPKQTLGELGLAYWQQPPKRQKRDAGIVRVRDPIISIIKINIAGLKVFFDAG